MFITNPDPYLLPTYRFSPFKTDYVYLNSILPSDDSCIGYLNNKFGKGNWQFTLNGREAIQLSLGSYNLKPTDLVTIVTTSQNFYISSCVTKEIEKFCQWNREVVPETKIIFVNHEFGYPYAGMDSLVATGLPIIEDCCTTFFSQDKNGKIGSYGDFSVYSLPKFFPIQIGGIVVKNTKEALLTNSTLSKQEAQYIQNVLSYSINEVKELVKKRKQIYDYSHDLFLSLGFTNRFETHESIIPYALVLNNNAIVKDLNSFKIYLTSRGIQNSIFYGEDAFFIPSHQNLAKLEIDYFFTLVQDFINKETNK